MTQAHRTTGTVLLNVIHGLGLLVTFLLGVASYRTGFSPIFLYLLLLAVVSVPIVVTVRLWGFFRKELAWALIRRPFQRENRRYALQTFLQWIFWVLLAFAVQLAIPIHFGAEVVTALRILLWGCVGALVALALIPNRRVRPSTSIFFGFGSLFLVIELVRILWPVPAADAVLLDPPFRGEWYVGHGGRSTLVNPHFVLRSQRDALDILKPREIDWSGQEESAPPALETYPAFGQTLYAPAAGRVVRAVNNRPDVEIGKTDLKHLVGNHVTIDIGNGRYVLMAHLMQKSVLVEPGDKVRSGQAIGRCGNSGNTSEPHLHMQVQSHADFEAKGLRTYPINFRDVVRRRSGRTEYMERADLRRNDVVIVDAQPGSPAE